MKRILILLCLPLLFTTCKKEEEEIVPQLFDKGWKITKNSDFFETGIKLYYTGDGYLIIGQTNEENQDYHFGQIYIIKTDLNGKIGRAHV